MRTGFKPYKCKQGSHSNNYGDYQEGHITESNGERYPIDIIKFNRDKDKLHSTQKPVALLEYLIKTYTNENDLVLDLFSGSGMTSVVSRDLNRRFVGCERDSDYISYIESEGIKIGRL